MLIDGTTTKYFSVVNLKIAYFSFPPFICKVGVEWVKSNVPALKQTLIVSMYQFIYTHTHVYTHTP